MYLTSMYPPVPHFDNQNAHHIMFSRPDQAEWPDYTLYIDGTSGRRLTYRHFLERVYDGATFLGTPVAEGGLGLKAEDGEIIGILSDNCIEYATLVHSLLSLAVPFSLLSSYSTAFELNHALRVSDVTRLFVHPRLLPQALRVAHEIGIPDGHIYILEGRVPGRQSLDDMIDRVQRSRLPRLGVRHAKKDTLAYLVFSSGTSGLPKVVMISHGNIIYTMTQSFVISQEWAKVYVPPPLDTPEGIPVVLAFLPMYHTYGLHLFLLRAFTSRNTLVLLRRWDLKTALEVIQKYRITDLPSVPSAIHQLVQYCQGHKANLSSLKSIASAAAYLPPQLERTFARIAPKAAKFLQGYGMSEVTLSAASSPFPGALNGRARPVPGSVGILVPGMEARILREDGSEADVDEPGDLYLKGGNVALGYWNNRKANQETFVDGWVRTGDRFRVDQDGNFFFVDRAKDTLKVSGLQVSPSEIENALLVQPDQLILDVAVAGVSGGRTADEKVPRAWIVLSDAGKKKGRTATVNTLDAWCRKNLSKYKWLRGGFEIVGEIPKSPTGKVLRRVLQDQYEESFRDVRGKL